MVILNFFNINDNPEIDYYKEGLILRNIIHEIFSPKLSMQKIDINQDKFQAYLHFVDEYDVHVKNMKEIFLKFDKDFDHVLNMEEFTKLLQWLIPYISIPEVEEIFSKTNENKTGKITYQEYKNNFSTLMNMVRIKNVIKNISDII